MEYTEAMSTKEEMKVTNEKPVKIPVPFKDALTALLATKPEEKKRGTKKKRKPSK